ncbi:hypothetical protein AUC43_17715 [Hymenobacter sedentarius]|uniref:UspA domain-containing protein n=1 Tax=Hymenobacter sedentarius TaxID=1411621 RepID=A0A0U4C270_9BACT|nr:universal stress protein [Hymenobacter sedentarius]ALW86753.1 hypothetical protein AUC43_17715 [Hymenobacter sedentarius]
MSLSPAFVVLTDFFAVTNRALSYAAGLAVPLKAPLVLLHVRHDELLSPEEYANRYTLSGERETLAGLHKLADSQPVPTEVEVSEEILPEAVADAVRHYHPQLVVLGRPGAATTPADVVRAAARDLLHHVPFPLLVVPTVGGAFPPRKLALAVDGDDFTLYEAHSIVQHLLSGLQASLTLLTVTSQPDTGAMAGPRARESVRMSGLVPSQAMAGQPHVVSSPSIPDGILQGAAEVEADLLVVIARRHSLLGRLFHHSTTAQLISDSPLPVLLMPALD